MDVFKKNDKRFNQYQFPWSTSAKNDDGLTVVVRSPRENKYGYNCFENSFIVHNTDEIPLNLNEDELYEYAFGLSLDVVITPEVVTTDKDLIKFSPEKRFCLFPNEKKLRFFKIYTKRNCEVECLSNYTKKHCDCAPFHFRRCPT